MLFYVLCLAALATGHIPAWLPVLAWAFVALRILHSGIQCTYNRVIHRFPVFLMGFLLLGGTWVSYAVSFLGA